VRWGLLAAAALLLTAAPAARSAHAQVTIQATPTSGPAPLRVSLIATGATSAHWDFGDGSSAEGVTTEHVFSAGSWTAKVTAQAPDGSSSTQSVQITATGLTLTRPGGTARYGRRVVFRGAVTPTARGVVVTVSGPSGKIGAARTGADGTFALRAFVIRPGNYVATSARGNSNPLTLRVIPRLVTALSGTGARGSRYFFTARMLPATGGTLTVRIARGVTVLVDRSFGARARIKLDTRQLGTYLIRAAVVPSEGFAATARVVRAHVVLPRLSLGSRGSAVAQLSGELRRLHYAAPYGATFDSRMLDAVYAFQKVQGLPRTGHVDARFWRALDRPRVAIARYASPASHIEVNKGRQVLYLVRRSRITLIVPISTAGLAGTFTPVGRFAVYRKVGGFDPSPLGTLYDPLYFTGGYAIHGNPSVPPYPASHGCIRVPMWVAPHLFATVPYGETVYVY
jgi:lipoprotein-anchoring transpeptidase ErfK/SrfK